MKSNKAPAPNRRQSLPLGGLGEFDYLICAFATNMMAGAQRFFRLRP
jgi:hypothetical protein